MLTVNSITNKGKVTLEIPNLVMRRLYVERILELSFPQPASQDEGQQAGSRSLYALSDLIQLRHSTGQSKIDEIIRGIIGLTERIFPEQVRGYIFNRDIWERERNRQQRLDLCVIFKGETLPIDQQRLRQIYDCCGQISSISLDIVAYSEVEI